MRKILFALAALVAVSALAAGGKSKYLVIAPHSAEECMAALDDIDQHAREVLKKIDWGCTAGDHTGYLTVEASSEADALKMVPERTRARAKAVKLVHFTSEQIKQFHSGK
ncbi:MAG: hypothetical protein ABR567_09390 [Myxococcales bacterium]|nr:hypothetical protein [Myxococcales bacterium]